ncbi:hypothetical protein OQA88_2531 [Cercophora sp. LCS_1]
MDKQFNDFAAKVDGARLIGMSGIMYTVDTCASNAAKINNQYMRDEAAELESDHVELARFCLRQHPLIRGELQTPPGYYLSDDTYKHLIELCPDNPLLANKSNDETLSDIMSQASDEVATVVDQLNIALCLVRATLQFWSTPWWQTYWSLRDIGVVREKQVPVLSDAFKSIHVNVELRDSAEAENRPQTQELRAIPKGLTKEDVERATLTFGIRNLNMYCLGVALLQVGRWSTVQIDDVEKIRRLAAMPSHLGPKYREITERCLECDFGVGKKIQDIRLQAAIYESVARPLESMIQSLSLNEETGSQSEY